MKISTKRKFQIIKYGLIDAVNIAKETKKSFFTIYFDILSCYRKHCLWSHQYRIEKLWALSENEREKLLLYYEKLNKDHDIAAEQARRWSREHTENRRFLARYSSMRYDRTIKLNYKRNKAYAERYNIDVGCWIQYGVTIIKEHRSEETIKMGEHVLLARNVDLDYTGGLTVGSNIAVLEGVKILTHGHDYFCMHKPEEFIPESNRAYKTPLTIGDNVVVGARSMIMPGVGSIGNNVFIVAGSVVKTPIPSDSLVSGNPATVVSRLPKKVKEAMIQIRLHTDRVNNWSHVRDPFELNE